MKIAVTLATGQLGRAIITELIGRIGAQNVIGIARSPQKGADLNIEMRQGDYDQPEHFTEALKGVDVVVCVSGMAAPEERIQQHRNVINGAKANQVRKIIYTSICGSPEETGFSPIVRSNRQTEQDIIDSGLIYAIGRNGIYLDPDLEYMDTYRELGKIINCAGEGKCAYTSRSELAYAYSKLALGDHGNNQVHNLVGESITQAELAEKLNAHFGTSLSYEYISAEAYAEERAKALNPFIGGVIAGIYDSIQRGHFDVSSDFERAAQRPHKSVDQLIREFSA